MVSASDAAAAGRCLIQSARRLMCQNSNMLQNTRRILAVALLAAIVSSNSDRSKYSPRKAQPALELKNVVSFPLSSDGLPSSSQGLIDALSAGLRGRVKLPDEARPVIAKGDSYPSLDQLTVDLTDASIDSGHQLPRLKPRGPIESTVHADDFAFRADPMKVDGASISLDVHAHDVQLGLQRDRNHTPILVLTSARDGIARCDTTTSDLSRMFRASADFRGRPYGLRVQRARLSLISDNNHQINADLSLASRLLLMPISLHFTARVDVDDAGNAHLSNLTCRGDDIAGWLISGFIRPELAQHNNRTIPLIAFPTNRVKLREVRVGISGDAVHLMAAFGS